jgi:hypothetical protein
MQPQKMLLTTKSFMLHNIFIISDTVTDIFSYYAENAFHSFFINIILTIVISVLFILLLNVQGNIVSYTLDHIIKIIQLYVYFKITYFR